MEYALCNMLNSNAAYDDPIAVSILSNGNYVLLGTSYNIEISDMKSCDLGEVVSCLRRRDFSNLPYGAEEVNYQDEFMNYTESVNGFLHLLNMSKSGKLNAMNEKLNMHLAYKSTNFMYEFGEYGKQMQEPHVMIGFNDCDGTGTVVIAAEGSCHNIALPDNFFFMNFDQQEAVAAEAMFTSWEENYDEMLCQARQSGPVPEHSDF